MWIVLVLSFQLKENAVQFASTILVYAIFPFISDFLCFGKCIHNECHHHLQDHLCIEKDTGKISPIFYGLNPPVYWI